MENLKSQLNLDALQRNQNVLTDSMRSQGILLKENWPRTKTKEIAALSETMDRKINEF
jgi:hypothetical protein